MKNEKKFEFKIYSFVLLLAGIISLIGFGSTQRISCSKEIDGEVDCISQVLWMGIVPLWKEQKIERVISVSIETNCMTEGTTNTERCANNVLAFKSASSEMIVGPFYFNEITALKAHKQIQRFFNGPLLEVVYMAKNLANMILGVIFVALPCLTLGILFAWGDKRK